MQSTLLTDLTAPGSQSIVYSCPNSWYDRTTDAVVVVVFPFTFALFLFCFCSYTSISQVSTKLLYILVLDIMKSFNEHKSRYKRTGLYYVKHEAFR